MNTRTATEVRADHVIRLCAAVAIAFAASTAQAQSCHPAPLRSDPSANPGATLVRVAGDFHLRESGMRSVRLQAGQSFWFNASGCPRTDSISLVVTDPDGKVVLERLGHVTGGCVKAASTGDYRVTVMPVSLRSGYDWGSIAAEGSKSSCADNG